MQAQFLFASLLVGLAVAMPQGFSFPDDEDDGCDQGKAILGPLGTVCIGPFGEDFGRPRTRECPDLSCFRMKGCEKFVKGPDGCDQCPPGC
ncbi:hypothetical protein BBO_08909 [Beauveria brongniartii RCEF 3172]|uniref:Uncharacterized protein n=1 Tax=Beauveria brongniartii RCEF 3172 TaxID=1081107 RepID=A0A166WUQ1_9HYPO|nr:hypothetical protein BBO_08909 [Beauveria brongniartii RCEF 3172]